MADQLLETLKMEIEALGTKIRELKETNSSTEDIGAAVEALKTAKKSYADANNGIGIDGQPYQEQLTKAQKKAKAKAEKEAAAAAAGAAATPAVAAVVVAAAVEGEDGSKEVGLEKG
jgi:chromosome segregation ATPase